MDKVWHGVMITVGILLILGVVVIGVAYITGGSLTRVINTSDIADLTKFFSREQIEAAVELFY